MRHKWLPYMILAMFGFGSLMITQGSVASDVVIYTESYPPYSFRNADGEIDGFSTRIVRQILEEAGLDYDIKLVPWGRAIKLASSQNDVLIYSLLKSKSRDKKFRWLVQLAVLDLYLYGRKEDARKVDLAGLQKGMFSVVCTTGDATCNIFVEMGIPKTSILSRADTQEVEAKLVASGRADFFIGQEDLVRELGRAAKKYQDRFRKVMKAPDGGHLYLAGGNGLRPDIQARIEEAYMRLRKRREIPAPATQP